MARTGTQVLTIKTISAHELIFLPSIDPTLKICKNHIKIRECMMEAIQIWNLLKNTQRSKKEVYCNNQNNLCYWINFSLLISFKLEICKTHIKPRECMTKQIQIWYFYAIFQQNKWLDREATISEKLKQFLLHNCLL